jgi:hypothetical protein
MPRACPVVSHVRSHDQQTMRFEMPRACPVVIHVRSYDQHTMCFEMPRACPVVSHVYCYVAKNVRLLRNLSNWPRETPTLCVLGVSASSAFFLAPLNTLNSRIC